MKIDFPVAVPAILPGRRESELCMGLSTREIDPESLEGSFHVVASIRYRGRIYTIRAEDAGGPYFVELPGIDRWGHLQFQLDGSDNALSYQRCFSLLASTLRGHEDQLHVKWESKFGSPLRDIGKMRLREIDTDLVDDQARLFMDFSSERYKIIEGTVHRLIDEPLIVVGLFDGYSQLNFDWDERPSDTLACYALSEWRRALADAQALAKMHRRGYDAGILRKLVEWSVIDRDVLDRRAGLLCHWFCRGLQSHVFGDIDHGFKLARALGPEDRSLLEKIAHAALAVDNGQFENDVIETGEAVLHLDNQSPLRAGYQLSHVRILADLLRNHEAPRISIDDIPASL